MGRWIWSNVGSAHGAAELAALKAAAWQRIAAGQGELECPPSLVAEALGYSTQVAFLHADKVAEGGFNRW